MTEPTTALNNLKASLTDALRTFAENHLDSGDSSYEDLHEIMVDHGLGGLKRTYTATVRVSYSFDVDVEAIDADDAQQQIEENIGDLAADNVYLPDVYDSDIEGIYLGYVT